MRHALAGLEGLFPTIPQSVHDQCARFQKEADEWAAQNKADGEKHGVCAHSMPLNLACGACENGAA